MTKGLHYPRTSHGDVRDNENQSEEEEEGDDVLVFVREGLDADQKTPLVREGLEEKVLL